MTPRVTDVEIELDQETAHKLLDAFERDKSKLARWLAPLNLKSVRLEGSVETRKQTHVAARERLPDDGQDIFISYAKADDCKTEEAQDGWVTSFMDLLEKSLIRIRGSKDCGSLWSHQLSAEDGPLTPKIVSKLEQTSIFIIVLSPEYLRSEWLAAKDYLAPELPIISKLVDGNLRDDHVSVYVVERAEVSEDWPSELENSQVFRFWEKEQDEAQPVTPSIENSVFLDTLNDLALEVAYNLRQLERGDDHRSASEPNRQEGDESNRHVTVYLAVPPDLDPLRRKLKRYFEQSGVYVVPENADAEGAPDQIEKKLYDSDLFVQLLSYLPGPKLSGSKESLAAFQRRRAHEMGLPILQWRSPDLSAKDVETDDSIDLEHQRLLLASTVQAVDIEDFNRDALKSAKPRIRSTPVPQEREGYIFVIYIDVQVTGQIDLKATRRPISQELLKYLESCELEYTTLRHTGRRKDARDELARKLLATDGMIVIYDHETIQWVEAQLEEVQRIFSIHRDKASSPKAVVEGPGAKLPIGMHLRNMIVIKCQDGFDADQLQSFLDNVEKRAQKRFEALQGPVLVEPQDHYDIFLAHNSVDKGFVKVLYRQLVDRGIYPWLDEYEILPGRWFQEVIQESMNNVSSAAIFIGQQGLGTWQRAELQAFMQQCLKEKLPLIPVLLPGVSELPRDLQFLEQLSRVRFKEPDDKNALDLLIRGIRGRRSATT